MTTCPPMRPSRMRITYFVYPYYGFNPDPPGGMYTPVRKGLHDFLRFPHMGDKVPGDLLVRRMTEVMNADADRDHVAGKPPRP